MSSRSQLTGVDSEAHLGIVSWVARGPLFVNAWWQPPTAAALRELGDAQLEACAAHGKLGVVTIIRPQVLGFLDEETRAAATATRKRLRTTFLSDACLVPDSGFMAAAVRSVLAGINTLSRSPEPQRIFSDARAAADYTARRLAAAEHGVDRDVILETIDYILSAAE
jgi:hypothetical protein